jgi:serine/threonine-protein kinase
LDPLPGYRITRQIGVGAGSKISLATELKTGKTFAVKHVVRQTADDQRFMDQAEAEYKVSHKLDHPYLRHSVHIHRVRKLLSVSELFLVMDYVDGLTLESARPNRLNTFLTIFQKVAEGLDAMHQAGWVHADIKPTNILLAPKGTVKIIDFGQSCPLGHRKERIQGTPDYIAPEQVRRMPLDQRTDVFNLGATMYWVLTSEKYPTAIRGQDARGGISLITADKPVSPNELNDKIPISLSNLVMECCRENPAERPADMKQVGSRLATIQKLWRKHREELRAQLRAEAGGTGLDVTAEEAFEHKRHEALAEDEPLGHAATVTESKAKLPKGER